MRSAIFLSARNKARRLPGKHLLPLGDSTTFEHLIDRLRRAERADEVILTTSTHADDGKLVELARARGIRAFRGSEDDKLVRYRDAAEEFGVDIAVIVDGDDLFCDPGMADLIIAHMMEQGGDYVIVDRLPLGATPFGLTRSALKRVCEVKKQLDTEVWGSLFTDNREFECVKIEPPPHLERPGYRMTLDYAEDYRFFCEVFEALGGDGGYFGLPEIVRLLDSRPEIAAISAAAQAQYEQNIAKQVRKQNA